MYYFARGRFCLIEMLVLPHKIDLKLALIMGSNLTIESREGEGSEGY